MVSQHSYIKLLRDNQMGPDGVIQCFAWRIARHIFALILVRWFCYLRLNEEEMIRQYRPIYLLNVSFKIFTKTTTIRKNSVNGHVVRASQTVFMQERNIFHGVLTLHKRFMISNGDEWDHAKTWLWKSIWHGHMVFPSTNTLNEMFSRWVACSNS
jgi:hypothetical protein